jgi:hypothetical protein
VRHVDEVMVEAARGLVEIMRRRGTGRLRDSAAACRDVPWRA